MPSYSPADIESGAQAYRDTQLNEHLNGLDDDDAIAERAEEMGGDPAKVAEADENWSGTLDGSAYSDIESALADLHDVPADRLIGSDALARVLRSAAICAAARYAELLEMAAADEARFIAEGEEARSYAMHGGEA